MKIKLPSSCYGRRVDAPIQNFKIKKFTQNDFIWNTESSCCNGGSTPKPPKPVKEKKEKPVKEKKPKKEKGAPAEGTAAEAKEKDPKASGKEKEKEKDAGKSKPAPVQVIDKLNWIINLEWFNFIYQNFALLNWHYFAHSFKKTICTIFSVQILAYKKTNCVWMYVDWWWQ